MDQKDMLEYLEHRQNKVNYPPYEEEKPRKVNLEMIISLVLIMVTTLGTTIPLYIHSNQMTETKLDAIRQDINAARQDTKDFREMWAQETRDFHGRLIVLEERTKEKS